MLFIILRGGLHIKFWNFLAWCIVFICVKESGALSAYEKQAIVDAHNRLRQSVALGQVSSQPPAANMMEMVSYKHSMIENILL